MRQKGCSVVGVDQSGEMLAEARRRLALAAETERVRLVEASAEELPFEDASFDGLTAAYLLRYSMTCRRACASSAECCAGARRLRCSTSACRRARYRGPPGTSGSISACPLPVVAISPGWHEVGRFLGGSIRDFDERWPVPLLLTAMREAGFEDVQAQRLSLGGVHGALGPAR